MQDSVIVTVADYN